MQYCGTSCTIGESTTVIGEKELFKLKITWKNHKLQELKYGMSEILKNAKYI